MGFFGGFVLGVFARPLGNVIDVAILGKKPKPTGESSARVVRAVDGDTLVVLQDSVEERVRVLGIDTPEVFGTKQCGEEVASRAAKRWVTENPIVTLKSDPAAPNRDKYGRLLRYVEPPAIELQAGEDLSGVQVRRGNARVAGYGQDLERLEELRRFERQAKHAGRGLWGACAQRHRPGRAAALAPAGTAACPGVYVVDLGAELLEAGDGFGVGEDF